jgi:hypothetical protein
MRWYVGLTLFDYAKHIDLELIGLGYIICKGFGLADRIDGCYYKFLTACHKRRVEYERMLATFQSSQPRAQRTWLRLRFSGRSGSCGRLTTSFRAKHRKI